MTLVGVARGLSLAGAPLGVAALLVLGLGPAVLVATAALIGPVVLFTDSRAWRPHR